MMKNLTVLQWLARNHPKIFTMWLEFQKQWKKQKRQEWYKDNYKPTGNSVGRPTKAETK